MEDIKEYGRQKLRPKMVDAYSSRIVFCQIVDGILDSAAGNLKLFLVFRNGWNPVPLLPGEQILGKTVGFRFFGRVAATPLRIECCFLSRSILFLLAKCTKK